MNKETKTFILSEPIAFQFHYAGSWCPLIEIVRIKESSEVADSVNLRIENLHKGVLSGEITLHVIRHTGRLTSVMLVSKYFQSLRARGMLISGAPLIPIKTDEQFSNAWLCCPEALFDNEAFDAPVMVLEQPSILVLLSLLGPARSTSPEWWAVNKRAFEIVCDTLTISDAR